MYICSKSHGEKIYHCQSCFYARKIKQQNRIFYHTKAEAIAKGYRACNCCAPVARKFRAEKRALIEYAKVNHINMWLEDNAVYMETGNGAWKIIKTEKSRRLILFHANRENYKWCQKKNGKIIHHYHIQKDINSQSILKYMKYIYKHDLWRASKKDEYKRMPVSTKSQRRKRKEEEERARRRAVGDVLNLIEILRVEREYQSFDTTPQFMLQS